MIMKQNSLAEYISKYFSSYLLDERGVTRSTIISYKNIMVQFLKYMNKTYNLNIDRIKLKDITFDKVNAERKSKVDDNTAKMQSIKWLGV